MRGVFGEHLFLRRVGATRVDLRRGDGHTLEGFWSREAYDLITGL